jgi:hypothetical protein
MPPTRRQMLAGFALWFSLVFAPLVAPSFLVPNDVGGPLAMLALLVVPFAILAALIVAIIHARWLSESQRASARTLAVVAVVVPMGAFVLAAVVSQVFWRGPLLGLLVVVGTLLLWAWLLARYVPIAWASWLARYNALVLMPLGGMAIDATIDACNPCDSLHRLLSVKHLPLFALSHFVVVAVYVLSRRASRRPSPWIDGVLWWGVFQHVTLAIHFVPALTTPFWILLPPLGGIALTPFFVLIVLGAHLRERALVATPDARAIAVFFACALAYFGLAALWSWCWLGAILVYTQTCSGTFARLTPPPAGNCCYVVTVAARGHRRIVRPLRVGMRHGEPIVVNRQLAIASAFEALLHERCPRVGRALRAWYDGWGPWAAAQVQSKWASDGVYVAMKPLEWVFLACLWAFDRQCVQARIDGTYR